MNSFTKKELQIWEHAGPVGTYIEGVAPTIMKIQSMIDNYCEHDKDALTDIRENYGRCKT